MESLEKILLIKWLTKMRDKEVLYSDEWFFYHDDLINLKTTKEETK